MKHAVLLALAFASLAVPGAPFGRAPELEASPLAPAANAPLAHPAPRALADSVRADGELRSAVLRNARDVRNCYEREGLKRNAGLRGTVDVELTILPTGVVEHVDVAIAAFGGEGTTEVVSCITTAAHNWRFERGPFEVEIVTFPFHLAPELTRPVASQVSTD